MAQLWLWKVSVKGPGFTEDLAMRKVEKEVKTQKESSFAPRNGLALGSGGKDL